VATLAPAPDGTFGQIADVVPGMADPDGADFVFESTGRRECVDAGIWLCRPFGCFVCQGNYGDGQVSFEFFEGHRRRLRLIFPSDDGYQPFRRASLRAVAFGAMPWGEVITHRISFEDMPAFYSDIYTGKAEHVIGAVVSWETAD
jgi:threonine dehydrogenase-like Zn-dependent dehydrogenase